MWQLCRMLAIPLVIILLAVTQACSSSDKSNQSNDSAKNSSEAVQAGDIVVEIGKSPSLSNAKDIGWGVKILNVSEPSSVEFERGPGRATQESPPAGRKWLVITVEASPPGKAGAIPSKSVSVVDESSTSHELQSASTLRGGESPSFSDEFSRLSIDILAEPGTKLSFLFAVPETAKRFSLLIPARNN